MTDIKEMSYKMRIKNLEELIDSETQKLIRENVELQDQIDEKDKRIKELERRVKELIYIAYN